MKDAHETPTDGSHYVAGQLSPPVSGRITKLSTPRVVPSSRAIDYASNMETKSHGFCALGTILQRNAFRMRRN